MRPHGNVHLPSVHAEYCPQEPSKGALKANVGIKGMVTTIQIQPIVFIPNSDVAAEERWRISQIMWAIHPGHDEPSFEDMIGGLRAISTELQDKIGSSLAMRRNS